MKSVTGPPNPGPFSARSARLPSAPPRISPSATAIEGRIGRKEKTTITTITTIVAPANSHGALRPIPNAPPEFVVYVSDSTPGITRTGGRPVRAFSTQVFVSRSRIRTAAATAYRRPGQRRAAPTGYRRDCAWASLMQRSA